MPDKSRTGKPGEDENSNLLDRLLGNPTSRAERDEALSSLILRVSGFLVAVVVLLIAGLLIYNELIVPNQTVATVNDESISAHEFVSRYELESALVQQEYQSILSQAQEQAAQFGVEPQQILQQNQRFNQVQQELQFPDQLGRRVINDMVDTLLIEQRAEELNISVDEAAIDEEVNEYFGYDPTQVALIGTPATATPEPTITPTPFVSPTPAPPTNTPVPTMTPTAMPEATDEATEEATEVIPQAPTVAPSPTFSQEERRENFETSVDIFRDSVRQIGGVGEAEIDEFFRHQALREALTTELFGAVETAPHVNARHILVDTEDEAQSVLDALNNGEPFAGLARAVSIDTGSGRNGGELGWSPAANYVPPFRDAVLEADIGVIVGPVESEFGYHIIQVRAREDREVEGNTRERIRQASFQEWLEGYREENEENITISDNWPSYLPAQ
jgi:parvulin-like peptidyl-prolyl isomerase